MLDPKFLFISAGIAVAALIVSCIALGRTDFSRLAPIVVVGRLRHRIYPIKSDKQRWFITSLDLPMTFSNAGAQPLLIKTLRLSLHYPKLPTPNNRELIYADWDIDPQAAEKIDKNRFQWLQDLAPRTWMPVAVLPKENVLKYVIFEQRWDDPVLQELIVASLECQSSIDNNWARIATWDLHLFPDTWGELANVGSSMSYMTSGEEEQIELLNPKDLHKYTGGKQPIPKEGFGASPSHLDYPKERLESSNQSLQRTLCAPLSSGVRCPIREIVWRNQ